MSVSFSMCTKEDDRWKTFASSEKGDHSYDVSTIRETKYGTRMTLERVWKEENMLSHIEHVYYHEFSCDERKHVSYLKSEDRLSGCKGTSRHPHWVRQDLPVLDIEAGSTVEKLFSIVCMKEKA
jgi:hypothetical protein